MTAPARPPVGVGQPVSAGDRIWAAVAAELAPEKSLARVDERAKHVVTSVSLVGSVLTGLGLIASGQLKDSSPARGLAVAAVGVALAAVVLALGSLLLRFTPAMTPGNLTEVQAWYRRQFRRAYGVVAAGLLLLVAVVLAGAATLVVLTGDGGNEPTMSVQLAGTGADAKLTVRVELTGAAAGQQLHIEVAGVDAAGSRTVLARGLTRAGDSATLASAVEVPRVGSYTSVEVTATVTGRHCTATLAAAPAAASSPVVACRRR